MIEKLSKYKDLGIEISTIWGLKTETVSVVIGALEQVKKGLGKYVEKIPGNINIEELQKISLVGTAAPKGTGCFSEHLVVRTAKKEKHDDNNNNAMAF